VFQSELFRRRRLQSAYRRFSGVFHRGQSTNLHVNCMAPIDQSVNQNESVWVWDGSSENHWVETGLIKGSVSGDNGSWHFGSQHAFYWAIKDLAGNLNVHVDDSDSWDWGTNYTVGVNEVANPDGHWVSYVNGPGVSFIGGSSNAQDPKSFTMSAGLEARSSASGNHIAATAGALGYYGDSNPHVSQ
jgi:hypothetical protein